MVVVISYFVVVAVVVINYFVVVAVVVINYFVVVAAPLLLMQPTAFSDSLFSLA